MTTQLRQAKAKYFDKEFDKCEGNVKKTWNIINKNIKTRSNNAKVDIREGDNLINSPELPNKFNNYFSNVADELVSKFSPEDNNFNNYLKNRVSNSFYLFNTSKNEIVNAINGLKTSNGINQISSDILKEINLEISDPLLHIFNLCIKEGYFPTELKLGCITPIFKKGDKYSMSNYRPVCSLSPFSKIFERIIYNRMLEFINKNNHFLTHNMGLEKRKMKKQHYWT